MRTSNSIAAAAAGALVLASCVQATKLDSAMLDKVYGVMRQKDINKQVAVLDMLTPGTRGRTGL